VSYTPPSLIGVSGASDAGKWLLTDMLELRSVGMMDCAPTITPLNHRFAANMEK